MNIDEKERLITEFIEFMDQNLKTVATLTGEDVGRTQLKQFVKQQKGLFLMKVKYCD